MSSDTAQTLGAIAFVSFLVLLAGLSCQAVKGDNSYQTRLLFFWLIFDALIHIFRTQYYSSNRQSKGHLSIFRYLDALLIHLLVFSLAYGKNTASRIDAGPLLTQVL